MRFKVRPDRLETADDPGFDVVRVQGVEQKHAGDKVVLEGITENPLALRRFRASVYQALQSGAMQLDHRLHQLQSGGPNLRVTGLIELACQSLNVFTLDAKLSAPQSGYRLLSAGCHLFGPRRPEHG
jgi:hypothetical protein